MTLTYVRAPYLDFSQERMQDDYSPCCFIDEEISVGWTLRCSAQRVGMSLCRDYWVLGKDR